jgi:hypothetical protein
MFSTLKFGTASVDTGFTTITGYIVTETTKAAAAVATFRNAASGTILWTVNLVAGETTGEQFGENPVVSNFGSPFYLSVDSGTVQYAVYGK